MEKTVLVAEDEKGLTRAIVDSLHLKNFRTLEAKNGLEAVTMALQNHPDLILLDLIMPKMDGMAAFKKIREDAWGANVPVIILTNLSATNDELVQEVVTDKPMYYLIKSDWKIHDVIDKIKEILNVHEADKNNK